MAASADLDEETRKALENAKIGEPSTYGGRYHNTSKSGLIVNEFTTHTIPDILPQTRIVAVCGATDEKDAAKPTRDGWFFSDFYLFHHLLKGVGSSQHWISSEDPSDLVSKYGEYLHGNPYKIRKVVLSLGMLEKGRIGAITIHPRNHLKANFIRTLKSECDIAQRCNENVLILVFGHGEPDTYGITVGTGNLKKMTISNVRSAIGPSGLSVTFLSTSCYSGGWSVCPRLNITTMTAAGPDRESTSWNASSTLGRFCGSIWSSAVIPVLLAESTSEGKQPVAKLESIDDILPEDASEVQDKTFSSFCHAIWTQLFSKVDRKAAAHDITFSAQDDGWEKYWAYRTGFPLADYKKRYDALDDYPISLLENPLTNRDVEMSRELDGGDAVVEAEERIRKPGTRSRDPNLASLHQTGFSIADLDTQRDSDVQSISVLGKRKQEDDRGSYQRMVMQMAEDYMASFPGEDNLGPNTSVHGLAKSCLRGEVTDPGMLLSLFHRLEYRTNIMKLADRYAELAGRKALKIPPCAQWDWCSIYGLMGRGEMSRELYSKVRARILRLRLFPAPNEFQGESWPKGVNYVAAALALTGFDEAVIDHELDALSRCRVASIYFPHYFQLSPSTSRVLTETSLVRRNIVEGLSHELMGEPLIRSKRQRAADALGRAVRSFSPIRGDRRSRGGSVASLSGANIPPLSLSTCPSE